MMPRTNRTGRGRVRRLFAMGAVAALVAAACAGDDDADVTDADVTDEADPADVTDDDDDVTDDDDDVTVDDDDDVTTDDDDVTVDDDPVATEDDDPGEQPDEPRHGGEITYAFHFNARNLDPADLGGASSSAGDGVYGLTIFDNLVFEDVHGTGEVEMRLAESLESDDLMNWTLTLRPDVTFTDGTPYDADAVKYNWERMADPQQGSRHFWIVRQIESMDVVDPLTLEVTLERPNYGFPNLIAKYIGFIGSPTAIEADPDRFANEAPVGAGPFMVSNWIQGTSLELERNPDYWDQPKPYVDRVTILYMPDDTQRHNTFVTGEANINFINRGYTQLVAAQEAGYEVLTGPPINSTFWFLNHTQPPFDDPIAREAMHYAIDREQMTAVAGQGFQEPHRYLFGEDSPYSDPDLTLPEYDPERAQQLIDQYADTHGGPMQVTCQTSNAVPQQCEFAQAQLTEFDNLEFELVLTTGAEGVERWESGAFTAAQFATQVVPHPDYSALLRTGARVAAYMDYSNPTMDEAFATAAGSTDPAVRAEAYRTVQEEFLNDLPILTLALQPQYTVLAEGVRGVTFANDAVPFFSEIWLDE